MTSHCNATKEGQTYSHRQHECNLDSETTCPCSSHFTFMLPVAVGPSFFGSVAMLNRG